MNSKPVAPRYVRRLSGLIREKGLNLRSVARKAGVNYSVASSILNGRRVEPANLAKLERVILAAPMPKEVTP